MVNYINLTSNYENQKKIFWLSLVVLPFVLYISYFIQWYKKLIIKCEQILFHLTHFVTKRPWKLYFYTYLKTPLKWFLMILIWWSTGFEPCIESQQNNTITAIIKNLFIFILKKTLNFRKHTDNNNTRHNPPPPKKNAKYFIKKL